MEILGFILMIGAAVALPVYYIYLVLSFSVKERREVIEWEVERITSRKGDRS